MDFDFLKKYKKHETLASWKDLLTDEEWNEFKRILEEDSVRLFTEKRKLAEKRDKENIGYFDYTFYGKCSEIRLANIFKKEGYDTKSVMLRQPKPSSAMICYQKLKNLISI